MNHIEENNFDQKYEISTTKIFVHSLFYKGYFVLKYKKDVDAFFDFPRLRNSSQKLRRIGIAKIIFRQKLYHFIEYLGHLALFCMKYFLMVANPTPT